MREQGDLGLTTVNSDLILAWSQYLDGREHLNAILGDVRTRALDILREQLHAKYRGRGERAGLAATHYFGSREAVTYKREGGAVWTGFRVPASVSHPTIRLNFWIADAGRPVFSTEVRRWRAAERMDEGSRGLRIAARKLAKNGFQEGMHRGEYVCWSQHEPNEYLRSADVPATLLELIETDFAAVVGSVF
jgi:hypothetical protein